ncbi:phospholipid-metabolizing enzyme A-C1-like [Larimichthys crocea]|uniref:phospholipid-metabolizing enzyme A-C1-like n=1 Tax=Larimichthys crocea TaxID=215358 RepID=UPI000F5FAB7C|nr:phospholipid-metabolizing enzyme A-C1-like [Larimichthys crocea]
MKILILVALILQVIIVQETDGYKFGDIIEFGRGCPCKPAYKHYGIYVGPQSGVNISQGDNDIFHHTVTGCTFGKLANTRGKWIKEKVDNYLDDYVDPSTNDEVKTRISEAIENCPRYHVTNRNCEHLATFVRYGLRVSMQAGTAVKFIQDILNSRRNKIKIQQRQQADLEAVEQQVEQLTQEIQQRLDDLRAEEQSGSEPEPADCEAICKKPK